CCCRRRRYCSRLRRAPRPLRPGRPAARPGAVPCRAFWVILHVPWVLLLKVIDLLRCVIAGASEQPAVRARVALAGWGPVRHSRSRIAGHELTGAMPAHGV